VIVATPADVLHAIAQYARVYAEMFVTSGPKSLSSSERAKRIKTVGGLADEIDALADSGRQIRYRDFEPILKRLHHNGFSPDAQLVSALAFVTQDSARRSK